VRNNKTAATTITTITATTTTTTTNNNNNNNNNSKKPYTCPKSIHLSIHHFIHSFASPRPCEAREEAEIVCEAGLEGGSDISARLPRGWLLVPPLFGDLPVLHQHLRLKGWR